MPIFSQFLLSNSPLTFYFQSRISSEFYLRQIQCMVFFDITLNNLRSFFEKLSLGWTYTIDQFFFSNPYTWNVFSTKTSQILGQILGKTSKKLHYMDTIYLYKTSMKLRWNFEKPSNLPSDQLIQNFFFSAPFKQK